MRSSASRPPDLRNPNRPPIDADRVRRALDLKVEVVGEYAYLVTGGSKPHYVGLYPYFVCDCGDFIWNDAVCMHLIATLLVVRDPQAMKAARAVLAEEG